MTMPGYGNHVPFAIGPSGAEFTGLTSWGNVTGSGRPENDATVGADASNLKAGIGVNMVFNGDYTDGLAGTVVGWRSGGNQHTLGRNLAGYTVQGEGTAYILQPGSPGTAVFDANVWNGQEGQHFAVTPGKKYEISAWLNCHRCNGAVVVLFLDAAGTQLAPLVGNSVSHASTISSIADMRQSWAIVTAPATAVKAYVIIRGYGINSKDPYVFFSRIYFGEAGAGQTEPSPWSPGRGISQITPSNVTTYIANAAIGNAQIDRASVNKLKVVTADIEDASITTLKVNGQAITVPVHAYNPGDIGFYSPGTLSWVTVQSAWVDPLGQNVFCLGTADWPNSNVDDQDTHMRIVAPNGAQLAYTTKGNRFSLVGTSNQTGAYVLQVARTRYSGTHYVRGASLFLLATKR